MFAAAFIQSISFLLFACSARLLLPSTSLSLTRRTVCIEHAVHLRRPPRADANDALAMLSPILRLRIDEYITLSAIEPFNDPTGWYLGLLLIVFSKRLSSCDTVTLCLDSISLIALSNFFLSLHTILIEKDTCQINGIRTAWFLLGAVFSAHFFSWSVSSRVLISLLFVSLIPIALPLLTSFVSLLGTSSLLRLPYVGILLLAHVHRNIFSP